MNDTSSTITFSADSMSCDIILSYLDAHNLSHLCVAKEESKANNFIAILDENQVEIARLAKPIRLGDIIDRLVSINQPPKNKDNKKIIPIGGGFLNTHRGLFTRPDEKDVFLTEKEVEIIMHLARAGGGVSRQELLSSIWNYVDDVETHTLETHIYRLRKKIEKDPAKPLILITDDNGYKISNCGGAGAKIIY